MGNRKKATAPWLYGGYCLWSCAGSDEVNKTKRPNKRQRKTHNRRVFMLRQDKA